jgi:membrane protein DedA with SNARE-associated domain
MMYLAVFLSPLVIDLIPIISPPAWMAMVFLMVKFDLNPWIVIVVGVAGSTIGRYIFSLYVTKLSDKLIKRRKREELEFLGKKLGQKLWPAWIFVFLYALTPMSTTPLFMAAGMAKIRPLWMLPPFFCGKLISNGMMVFAGEYAAANLKDFLHGVFSPKGILLIVFGLVVIGGVLFVDWRWWLEQKKFKLTFRIWK